MLQPPVVERHHLVPRGEQRGGDGAQEGVEDDRGEGLAAEGDRGLVDGLQGALRDLMQGRKKETTKQKKQKKRLKVGTGCEGKG